MNKAPERMCVGCREHREKAALVRVVRTADGSAALDFGGRAQGRGAYLCRSADCLKKARKSRALERALGVSIPEDVFQKLIEELNG